MLTPNKLIIALLVLLSISMVGCAKEKETSNTDYPPMIYWNDKVYYVQDLTHLSATKDDLDTELGEITKIVDGNETPKTNGSANIFATGNKLFSLNNDEDNQIAIEYENKYYIAIPKE